MAGDKVLHLLRHGVTEMNVYLSQPQPHCRYGGPHFRDPMLHDTRLTQGGREGARQAAQRVRRLRPEPELLVVSPLTRALETATLAFGVARCPTLVEPLWRERLYLSSDVGRPPAQLATEFPHFDFSHLPELWWHTESPHDPLAVHQEPEDVFDRRMREVRRWLERRPERCLAVVSHWGALQALTGADFDNCELRTVALSSLAAR